MTRLSSIKVAFDNAGGVVIVSPRYAHDYAEGEQPAKDVRALLDGGEIDQWDGNEVELGKALRNGEIDRYERVYTVAEIKSLLAAGKVVEDEENWVTVGGKSTGYSESQFFRLLGATAPEVATVKVTADSSDENLMAAYESLRRQACGDGIGKETDTPAEAVDRACATGEVIGMRVIRTIYGGTNEPATPVLATDTAERLWVVNDIHGPWAIQVAGD